MPDGRRKRRDCTASAKNRYASKGEADDDLARIRERSTREVVPVRSYRCDNCSFWHLTSQQQRIMPRRQG